MRTIFAIILAIFPTAFDPLVVGGGVGNSIVAFVLLLWELLPIFMITFFCRNIPTPKTVDTTQQDPLLDSSTYINTYSTPGLFQNPNRYDDFGDDVDDSFGSNRHSYGSPARRVSTSQSPVNHI